MTPQQVESAARRRYNSENDTFWSQDEIFKVIYEAELELAVEALVIEARDTSTSTVASTQTYALPSLFIAVKRIEYNGQKLQPIDQRLDDMLTMSNSGTTETGTPQYYWIWNDTIYLRPIPDAAQTLTIYGYKEPTLLTTASTTLSVPTKFHKGLIDYTISELASKDQKFDMATKYERRWREVVKNAREWTARKKRTDGYAVVKDEESQAVTILGAV